MLHFSCPRCDARIRGRDEISGLTAPCPSCGRPLRVPDWTPPIVDADIARVRGTRRLLPWLLAAAFALAAMASAIALYVYLHGEGKPLGYPATCREVVERLEKNGLKLEWHARRGPHPSVWVALPKTGAAQYISMMNDPDIRMVYPGWAAIEQYPTEKEAIEEAGRIKGAFSWGRFVVWGTDAVVVEMRKRL